MSEPFFSLPTKDQAGLIGKHATSIKMLPGIIEKDIWVCWALDKLFQMPDRRTMAFKGGTSLSKVYKAIDRFSEDIDVTIDYRDFATQTDGTESRSELTRLSDSLKEKLKEHSIDTIKPYFESILNAEFHGQAWKVELENEGEKLFIHYPSALNKGGYIESKVLLEFGVRNVTVPAEQHIVKTYISEYAEDISFPEASIAVLARMRTFWEKATLAHVEYHRPTQRKTAERLSRHWYDLYKMSNDIENICSDASRKLLSEVVKHKKQFFHYGYANYDDCVNGNLRLVPQDHFKKVLAFDFSAMLEAGMFYQDPPAFEEILEKLKHIEDAINEPQ